ncbi:MAG: type II toxin-antitoxin system HicB family antitoxin [Clostridiales bacterium]|nr:type II toxin-antitoxin system HicB family antitoxin [Clostridiales bacterium]
MIYREYPAVFAVAKEGGYMVYFPDLKGCVTQGDTVEDAYKNAKEALHLYLDGMSETPKPTAADGIEPNAGGLVMLINADGTAAN